MFRIIKAMVLLTDAADKVFLFTDFPCPYVKDYLPSQEPLTVSFEATYDTGVEYVRNNFSLEPEVVNSRHFALSGRKTT